MLGLVSAAIYTVRPRGVVASVASSRIAVLPFTHTGHSSTRYLEDGVVELLATGLDGAADLLVQGGLAHQGLRLRGIPLLLGAFVILQVDEDNYMAGSGNLNPADGLSAKVVVKKKLTASMCAGL